MKNCCMAVWLSVVLLAGTVLAQEAPPPPPPADPIRAIEIQQKQLDLKQRQAEINFQSEQRQAELNFQNEMRKIQLEKKRLEVDQERQSLKAKEQKPDSQWGKGPGFHGGDKHKWMQCTLFMLICAAVHVLLAIWVYQDIRRRNSGSGLWIVITLLTGFFGALVYAVVRIGDKPALN